jgi:DNA gyrase/topoisomerase IV subunit A
MLEADIQRYKDIIQAIKKNVGNVARQVQSRGELIDYLAAVDIVNTDYIADLPVYRFTVEEKNKVEQKIEQALLTLAEYNKLLSNEQERRKVYIQELTDVLQNYNKGKYRG